MYQVSEQYKDGMKRILRNKSHIEIYVGVINSEAQNAANIENNPLLEEYSNLKIFDSKGLGVRYASNERNYTKLDDEFCFLPQNLTSARSIGVVTKNIVTKESPSEITFKFVDIPSVDLKGLSINFTSIYPTKLEILWDKGSIFVSNEAKEFSTSEVFEGATFITLKALEMVKPETRLRIDKITCGNGMLFDQAKLIRSSQTNRANQINESLPSADFSFEVENTDRGFDIENPDSTINFLETGQELTVKYGYELDDNTIEWVQGGKFLLSDWESDDTKAIFNATDLLPYLDNIYTKGRFYESGISLYDLAVIVFKDAGISADDYTIDSYLKKEIIHNPLPAITHKECLQLIANAGRATMYINRNGMISLRSSFMPELSVVTDSTKESEYSKASQVLDSDSVKGFYATNEQDYTLIGISTFLPENPDDMIYETGYISKEVADSQGFFIDENPKISILAGAPFSSYGIEFNFGPAPPNKFKYTAFKEGIMVATEVVSGNKQSTYILQKAIYDFDAIEIEFLQMNGNYRGRLNSIKFGESAEYKLKYDDMIQSPKGIQLQKIKDIIVSRKMLKKDASSVYVELVSDEVEFSSSLDVFEFLFESELFDFIVTSDSKYTPIIVDSGSHWIKVRFKESQNQPTLANINIKAKLYDTSISKISFSMNSRGITKSWENPLISSQLMATKVMYWVAEYFYSDKEYEIEYRGEPALDPYDVIFLENKYNPDLKATIFTNSINYDGTLSGQIQARRVSNVG